jgi:hypothetical protein
VAVAAVATAGPDAIKAAAKVAAKVVAADATAVHDATKIARRSQN